MDISGTTPGHGHELVSSTDGLAIMGTIGKILLVINLLAAAGLAYLVTQDWAKRQEVTATVLRYHMTLRGLPLTGESSTDKDSIPFRMELSGGITTSTIRQSLLDSHFQQAQGGPVLGGSDNKSSQVEEVKRVQGKIKTQIGAAASPKEKLSTLCGAFAFDQSQRLIYQPGVLTRLAETYQERELVRKLASATSPQAVQDNAALAEAMLDKRFQAVISEPNPQSASEDANRVREASEKVKKAAENARQAFARFQQAPEDAAVRKTADDALSELDAAQKAEMEIYTDLGSASSRDESDRRARTAHLLTFLDPSPEWQKRVALTVGLRQYQKSLARHTDNLRAITRATESQTYLDQTAFAEEYELLKSLSGDRQELLARQKRVTADLRAQQAKDREAVTQRAAQHARRQAALASIKKDVSDALAKQSEVESKLFAIQKQVGETLTANYDLESKLTTAEQKSGGGQ